MSKNIFKLDERDLNIFRKICTTFYLITIYSLIGIVSYRQFILDQPNKEWNDIAMLLTVNILATIGAYVFIAGGIEIKKFKLHHVLIGFTAFVAFGLGFTVFKYSVLLGQTIGWGDVWEYFLTVVQISGIMALGLLLLAYLGNQRIEKKIK